MGHHSESHGPSLHHNGNNDKSHDHTSYTNQMDNSNVEMRHENNSNDYKAARRSTKLVDVGSQTSSESQKQFEISNAARTYTPERPVSIGDVYGTKNAHSVPTIPHIPAPYSNSKSQNTQTNLSRMDTTMATSRGFMTAFNSLATVAVPEMQHTQQLSLQHLQPVSVNRNRDRERSQPRQSYQQRHNTTALTKQPISRSVHNFNSLVNDSGYGSLDKLRPFDGNYILTSPTFSKRSIVQSKLVTSNGGGVGISSNDIIHINGLSHSQNETNSPIHSDSGGDSPRGSNGFVNFAGIKTPTSTTNLPIETNNLRISMKDTAYDRVRSNRKKR